MSHSVSSQLKHVSYEQLLFEHLFGEWLWELRCSLYSVSCRYVVAIAVVHTKIVWPLSVTYLSVIGMVDNGHSPA